jgi:hypothetical protein
MFNATKIVKKMELNKLTISKEKCRCTRCGNEHPFSERIEKPEHPFVCGKVSTCLRCGCKSYYHLPSDEEIKYCTGVAVLRGLTIYCQKRTGCLLYQNRILSAQFDPRKMFFKKKDIAECRNFKKINPS